MTGNSVRKKSRREPPQNQAIARFTPQQEANSPANRTSTRLYWVFTPKVLPVSYTHLGEDGMGRSRHTEAQIIAALKQVEAGHTVEDAVSYTHLDVYKRQPIPRWGGPPVLPLRFRIRRTPGRWRGCAGRRRRAGCRWRRCSLRWSRSTGWRRGSLRRCGSLRTCSGWRVHAGSRRPRAHPRRTRPHGGRRSCWPRVALADQLHVENQLLSLIHI